MIVKQNLTSLKRMTGSAQPKSNPLLNLWNFRRLQSPLFPQKTEELKVGCQVQHR